MSNYVIEWTERKRKLVCDEIEIWMHKRGSAAFCGEGIMQNDDCQIYAADLIATLVDEIIKPTYVGDED